MLVMNEADINQRIMQWLYALPTVKGQHHPDSRRATCPGWPDWEFVGPHGILYREIKGSNDVLTPAQRAIGRLIMIAGGDWMVWGPRDIARGIAEKQLEEISLMESNDPTVRASDSIMRRIQLMAEFIRERHAKEFDVYWSARWKGKVKSAETLEFLADPELIHRVCLHRKVML